MFHVSSNPLQSSIECVLRLIFLNIGTTSNPVLLLNSHLRIEIPKLIMTKFVLEEKWFSENQPGVNVIHVQNSTSLFKYLNNYFDSRFMDSNKKFIFYGNISSDITSVVQKFYINNAIFFDSSKGKIFTYYPLRYRNIRKIDRILVQIGTCNESIDLAPQKNDNFYDYKGWTVHIWNLPCRENYVGFDILKMILNYWRVSYKIYCKETDVIYKILMMNHEFDIMFTNMQAANLIYIGKSEPYHFDTLSIFILAPSIRQSRKYLLFAFTTMVWYSFIATVLIISVCWILARINLQKQHAWKNFSRIFQFHSIKTKNISEAILFIFMIIFEFLIGSFYGGALFQMETTHEMQNLTVVSADLTSRKIAFPKDALLTHLFLVPFVQRIRCEFQVECLRNVISEGNMNIVMMDRMTRKIRQSFENGTVRFVKKTPPLKNVKLILEFARGHPLIAIYNKYLRLFRENGLIYRIEAKYDRIPTETKGIKQHIGFNQILPSFFLLGFGFTVGFIIFLVELKAFFSIIFRCVP